MNIGMQFGGAMPGGLAALTNGLFNTAEMRRKIAEGEAGNNQRGQFATLFDQKAAVNFDPLDNAVGDTGAKNGILITKDGVSGKDQINSEADKTNKIAVKPAHKSESYEQSGEGKSESEKSQSFLDELMKQVISNRMTEKKDTEGEKEPKEFAAKEDMQSSTSAYSDAVQERRSGVEISQFKERISKASTYLMAQQNERTAVSYYS